METATFGLLGPVEVRVPGRPPVTLPPSVRALLARLALSAGRVVSVDSLTDALWGEHLPADAANALQVRVSKLRRALTGAGVPTDVVVTRPPGYLLAVEPTAVDAYLFEQLVGRARELAAGPTSPDALTILDQALALWRGPAVADVGDGAWIEAENVRLDELRIGAQSDRLELLLELGRHEEAVADLERLVALHPLRERLHRQLIVGLYRGGRQADALTVYHRLRKRLADELGIDPSPELQALAQAVLQQQLPQPTAAASPTSPSAPETPTAVTGSRPRLPPALTEIVGRRDDVDAVLARLKGARLVTLTGPGGVGKTTLAMEVARHSDTADAGAVTLIRLAPLEPGADVAEAVARQLGLLPAGPGEAAIVAIVDELGDRRARLVVDNCEHVIDSASAVLERILQSCPHVTVLATSREALALPGELQVAVHPLPVPPQDAELAAIREAPAVQLFTDRARAVHSSFSIDADNAAVVALICRQLDGVPLAIELAAARVKALPVQQIADRLADRFSFLSAGPRSGEARHRTLRATLDWSYQLLSSAEQALLRRLAVFRGGWTLAAAERVCSSDDIEADDVLELLFRLVDRSLVVPDPETGRFRLLVTIRDYGWAKLREADETELMRTQHLNYFTEFAQEHGSLTRSGETGASRMNADHDNLRAALDFAIDRARRTERLADADAGFHLANAMVWFWMYNLRYEGVAAIAALLALPNATASCRALAHQGQALFNIYYPTEQSSAAARESLAELEQLGDAQNAAISKVLIAWEGQYGGATDQSWALVRQAEQELDLEIEPGASVLLHYVKVLLHLGEGSFDASAAEGRLGLDEIARIQHRVFQGAMLSHLGIALRETGRHREAIDAFNQAIVFDERDGGSVHGLAFALVHLGHTLISGGNQVEARDLLARGDDVARRLQNPRCQAWAAWGQARLALTDGRADVALHQSRRAIDLLRNQEFPWAMAQLWEFVAQAATAAGQPDIADDAQAQARQVITGS